MCVLARLKYLKTYSNCYSHVYPETLNRFPVKRVTGCQVELMFTWVWVMMGTPPIMSVLQETCFLGPTTSGKTFWFSEFWWLSDDFGTLRKNINVADAGGLQRLAAG